MRSIHRLLATAAALTGAVILAACSSGSGSIGSGSTTQPRGVKEHGGTVTVAWPATPNLIFPLPPATNTDGFNVNLDNPMWPVLVYPGDGGQSVVNTKESLFTSMAWSDGDKTLTIGLKHWNWSDGTPVTSRDFTFVYNLLRYNVPDWYYYVNGLFPSDVASVVTPDAHTVVLHLTRSYNPSFFEDDVLCYVPLLPQHAWDKTSVSGKAGNYDETKAGAKAVWNFLQKQGSQMTTFATNPLWQVVDGPWRLSSFQSNGDYTYVPNTRYSGPDKPILSKVVNDAYTTDTAVLNALRSGGSLDVGTLPQNDVRQAGVLRSEGYSLATLHVAGVAAITPNFYNAQAGPVLRQLYIRQAMEYLIDRPQLVSKVYEGYADPGNGPVPVQATPSWVSPLERSGGPYPYSPPTAVRLLKAHGWKVVPNGTSTCQRAGSGASDCGAGISSGEPLSFQLIYSSGMTSMDEQEAAIQSSEAQAGVKLSLKSEPFNTLVGTVGACTAAKHPASTCGWQLVDEGYDPYQLYPNGTGLFNTGAYNNQGGYSSTEMNNLINATEYGPSKQAFFAYEDYAARQLPWLWLPDADFIQVYKSNLASYAPLNPFSGGLNPEVWYYTK